MEDSKQESKARQWAGRILVGLLFLAALLLLKNLLARYHYHEIETEIRNIPVRKLIWACIFCVLNYVVLTFYDTLANIYVGKDLPYRRTALTAFISYTFSQNLGFALLSGGAVRYRLYTAWGFSLLEIARVVAFAGFNFWFGLFTLVGFFSIINPRMMLSVEHFHGVSSSYAIGIILLSFVAFYFWGCWRGGRSLSLWGWELSLPRFSLALAALTVACLDWLLAAATLYALLPNSVQFIDFVTAFCASQAVGVISHVPGGLGVFEALMVMIFGSVTSGQKLVGALILYRLIYYIVPFFFGALAFLFYELSSKGFGRKIKRANAQIELLLRSVVPPLLSMIVFVAGVVLLISGATPAVHERLAWLSLFFPLALLEFSHFMNSIIGLVLLFLAWSIQKRIHSAYLLTLAALFAGALVSLGKGADFEVALWMLASMLALLPCRRYFYRSAALFSGFNWAMFGAILSVIVAVTWIGLFSFKHVTYSHSLWWQFTSEGNVSRFLRASLGISFLFLSGGLWWLLRPATALSENLPSVFDLEAAKVLLSKAKTAEASLVLVGDKSVLFNEAKTAFLMYSRSGRSAIALGDPVGDEEETKELVWLFRDLCDKSDLYCVYYQVSSESLPNYLDIGLLPYKLGEVGMVKLASFSLEGGAARGFRYTINKCEGKGFEFRIHPVSEVIEILPRLKQISDEWLETRNTREKVFSVGSFSAHYLSHFPIGTVEKDGEIVAFANILNTADKKELSVDLMRYSSEAPENCMEYLFLKLILWGKQQGYELFNLGMAPLSGLEARRLAPFWQRAGALLYDKGEFFYNFEGLRKFKEKFHPEWKPSYLVSPGGLALPRVITAVTTLIAGGIKGVFSK